MFHVRLVAVMISGKFQGVFHRLGSEMSPAKAFSL